MTAPDLLRRARSILDPAVALALRPIGSDTAFGPVEEAAVARAIPDRRAEFFAGRAAAREAMTALGLPPVEIARGADRAPRWPDGVIGSISHDAGQAIAAVARVSEVAALGIDLARGGPLDPALWPTILTEAERDGDGHAARARFAAKEALFKALHPRVGRVFGFHAAEVTLTSDRFVATLTAELGPFAQGDRFEGAVFGRGNDLLLAVLAVSK